MLTDDQFMAEFGDNFIADESPKDKPTIPQSAILHCMRAIMAESPKGYMAYAQAYAKAYIQGIDRSDTQIMYILSNLQHWRGDKAKKVKRVLKKVIK